MRKEHDFLGELEVADELYYGVQTIRALENFHITGKHLDQDFIKALAMVKKASRRANMKTAMKTNIRAGINIRVGISTMAGINIRASIRSRIIIRPSTRPAIRTRPAAGINIRSSLKKRMGWQSPPWSWESCPLSHAAAAGLHLCWESWASYLPSCPGARTACAARPRRD